MIIILPIMHKAYLLTGSNLGDRVAYLRQAIQLIQQSCGEVGRTSCFYQTAAWGYAEQPDFYNQAIELYTGLAPEILMQHLLDIEESMGRKRSVKMGPRIIDIDILLVDDKVINTPLLSVPHPHLAERRFALMPLAEIAPNAVHPVLQKTVFTLLEECPDMLDVHKIYENK
jgi:2-amino-4-hydroxy-6-hydroxymethyldihydropteridine diphosphokinase